MDNLKYRGQQAEVNGLPSLDLAGMGATSVPSDFEFEGVFGDIIMCELIDENEHGEVMRDGIYVKQEVTHKLWRRGKVVLKGPQCTELEIGDEVAFPSDKGVPMVSTNKKKYIFLNMERLFGKLKPLS
jgi:co-chaperonin GroES (HSP10)